jgi:hypothetical protein
MRHHLTALVLTIALTGCQDRDPSVAPVAPATGPAPMQRVAYLSVSDLAPEVGSTIIVAANVGVGDSLAIASFKVRLAYDAKALYYLGDVELPGMMRVVNPQASEIIVAGASGSGSADGRLFAMKFRVDDATGLKSLALSVDELNDTNFNNRLPSLKQDSRLQLERKLAGVRSIRR